MVRGILSGCAAWTIILALAWAVYPLEPEGFEAAGLTLLLLGLPGSLLLNLFGHIAVFKQMVFLSLFGYLQWPVWGILLTAYKERECHRIK